MKPTDAEGAEAEHRERDGEDRARLAADVDVRGDAGRSVGVHQDGDPAALGGLPLLVGADVLLLVLRVAHAELGLELLEAEGPEDLLGEVEYAADLVL